MFLQRTLPPNKRQIQRQRQLEYQKDLDKQVNIKQQQKMEELAKLHAEKYSQQFGLVNKIAEAPDSGFSVSPRYNQPLRPEFDNIIGGGGGGGGEIRRYDGRGGEIGARGGRVGERDGGDNGRFVGGGLARTRRQSGQALNDQLTMDLESRFKQISKAFLAADIDRSGSLEVGELRRLCKMYNLPTNRVESAFALSDMDRNGSIDYNEFISKLVRKDYTGNTNAPMPGMGRRGGVPNQYDQNNEQQHFKNSTRYRNSLGTMWKGSGTGVNDGKTKRALQREYQQELAKQVYERQQREKKAKQLEQEDERRAEQQATQYNPWGRGGAGAPLTDERGRMITDLRDVHEVAALGGISPKQDRVGGVTGGGGYDRSMLSYGSPNGMRGGVINQSNNRSNQNPKQFTASITGNQYTTAENEARQMKADALKSALATQIEEKRRRQALDKQRRIEMERREEERVKREQYEIRKQYEIEHVAQQKKEADLAEANRKAAELAKQKARATVVNGDNKTGDIAPDATREEAFSPQRNFLRTPPGAGGYSPKMASVSHSNGSRRSGGGGRGSMSVLRRELNDQHSSLLRKIEEQRNTIDMLRKKFDVFQQNNGFASARGSDGGGSSNHYSDHYGGGYGGSGSSNYGGNGGGSNSQKDGWAPGRQDILGGNGKINLQNIDLDSPDEMDNMLLDFVNKRGGYGPAKMSLPQF
jgi:hypothetical protein